MKYLSLALTLVSSCLAADSSNRSKNGLVSDELKLYVNFDANKLIEKLEDKYLTIERASEKTSDELEKLELDSAKWEKDAILNGASCEMYIHRGNQALIRLFKLRKPFGEMHAAYDSWMEWGFDASKFIDLIKEDKPKYSEEEWKIRFKKMADDAISWHNCTEEFLKNVKGNEGGAHYRHAQRVAIEFIYRTKTTLNSSDNAELERCIKGDSVEGVRKLARDVVDFQQYTKPQLRYSLQVSYFDAVLADLDNITLMAYVFCQEILLALSEYALFDAQLLLGPLGIAFDLKAALDKKAILFDKGSSLIVETYQMCARKVEAESYVGVQEKCDDALQNLWDISIYKQNLEVLTNKFNGTTDSHYASLHNIVVQPAFIYLRCKSFRDRLNLQEFLGKLRLRGFYSLDEATKGKLKLKQLDGELYNTLLLLEKSTEYYLSDDFKYIRDDFNNMKKKLKPDEGSEVYHLVSQIVLELEMDSKVQQCSFNFESMTIDCHSPHSREVLMMIHKNKAASRMLINFCLSVDSRSSLPFAIANFKKQEIDTSGYSVITKLGGPQ